MAQHVRQQWIGCMNWPPLSPMTGQVSSWAHRVLTSQAAAGQSNLSFLSISCPVDAAFDSSPFIWLPGAPLHLVWVCGETKSSKIGWWCRSSALPLACAAGTRITCEIQCSLSPYAFGRIGWLVGLQASTSWLRLEHTNRESGVHASCKKHWFFYHLIEKLKIQT
jgi:hypothetical protein